MHKGSYTGSPFCYHSMKQIFYIPLLLLALTACNPSSRTLPIYGEREVLPRQVNGQTVADTLYHTIPDFAMQDQFGDSLTQASLQGKVYVADFFFVNCPSICPLTTQQMLRLYNAYKDDDRVVLISHTLAPETDSIPVLHTFAERLGANNGRWRFLRGPDRLYVYTLAREGYYTAALDDSTAPGGIEHSGMFSLVDTQKRIRGFYDGTDPKQIDQLLKDLPILLEEEFGKAQ